MKYFYFLIVFVLSFPSNTISQSLGVGSTEDEFTSYFKSNIGSLDPLEGLWLRKQKGQNQQYVHEQLQKTENEDSEQYIAIVWMNNEFKEFSIKNSICEFICNRNSVFSKTPEKNKYIVTLNYESAKGEIKSFTLYDRDFHINEYVWNFYFTGDQYKDNYWKITTEEFWHRLYPSSN